MWGGSYIFVGLGKQSDLSEPQLPDQKKNEHNYTLSAGLFVTALAVRQQAPSGQGLICL